VRVAQDTPFVRRGGPPPVDLVNTEILVRGRPVDLLPDDEAVARWIEFERERLDLAHGARLPRVRKLVDLRATLRRIFSSVATDSAPAAGDLEALNRVAGREPVTLSLEWSDAPKLRAHPTRPEPDALAAVARAALAFLASPERERLRRCGNPRCVLFFVQSNRRQQWCSEACGRRVRADRFARRHRPTAAT
jgi:predicted RNA-binding Zn ribbon-like protein